MKLNRKMLLFVVFLPGCAPGSASRNQENADSHANEVTSIPAAILGEAGPPRGLPVQYFAADSQAVGYLAVPDGDGPFPALILIHEWNGLVDRVRQVADAFADEGYIALAADLYSGQVGNGRDENPADSSSNSEGALVCNRPA